MAKRRCLSESEIAKLMEASDSDVDDISEYENHTSSEENEKSDSEDNVAIQCNQDVQHIQSKDGKINWSLASLPLAGRLNSANVIKTAPGVTRYSTSRIKDVQSAFEIVFNSTIQNEIIRMTNAEGEKVFKEKWKTLDVTSFQAYVGLLLLAGVYKSHGESTKSLWDPETGRTIFRATMSHEKFCSISRVLRFDNKSTREERRRTDKLAAVREIWEKWLEVLPKLYYPSENITVDEQLVSFRGRCPFKQYMPSKPAKYGIKIWTLCDSITSYVLKAQIYTGKEPGGKPEKNQGMRVVSDLTYEYRGHNVTCDNFFTSYNLGQLLLKRNITMLGTIRKNKPELPKNMTNNEVHSSSFYFTKDTTIVNYVPKKNKNVLLMSTMHHDQTISNRPDKKPKIILDYNACKGAVDTLDQLLNTYTCKRKTNRWPMIVFYNMLDCSAYNAFILWTSINYEWNEGKLTKRRIFLEELGKQLISTYIQTRQHMPRNEESRKTVEKIQGKGKSKSSSTPNPDYQVSNKRARCKFCPSSYDNKTNILCKNCKKHICKLHVSYYCPNCK